MKKISYIDGLKSFACIAVIIIHFALAFAPIGYVGFGSGVSPSNINAVYLNGLPYSLFLNNNFVLYVFFAVISFVISARYFETKDNKWIQKQATIRYFRLVIPVLIASVLSFILYYLNLVHFNTLGDLLNNNWLRALQHHSPKFLDSIVKALISPFVNAGEYNSPTWCIYLIFYGSMLTYAVLLLFGSNKKRSRIYLLLALVALFTQPTFLTFLGGLMAGDYYVTKNNKQKNSLGIILFVFGFLLSLIPLVLILPTNQYLLQMVGACISLFGIIMSKTLQNIFSHKWLLALSPYSFELYITHALVLSSFTPLLYMWIYQTLGLTLAPVISTLVSLIMIGIVAVVFQKLTAKPTGLAVNKLYNWLS